MWRSGGKANGRVARHVEGFVKMTASSLRRAFSLTFRAGLYPLSGRRRADRQPSDPLAPPAGRRRRFRFSECGDRRAVSAASTRGGAMGVQWNVADPIATWLALGQQNRWIRRAADPPFTRRSFVACADATELKRWLSHGNWCVGSAFFLCDLASSSGRRALASGLSSRRTFPSRVLPGGGVLAAGRLTAFR